MKFPTLCLLTVLALGSAPIAQAGVSPYFRSSYGGGRLEMGDVNRVINSQEGAIRDIGYPEADFKTVGASADWRVSGGLWLFPDFRVGAAYSRQRSFRQNRFHPPGYFFQEDLTFRMEETGVEAAVRIPPLAGLSFGGEVSRGVAHFVESIGEQSGSFYYGEDGTAHRTKTTYGAFVGFDQTNEQGWAGFARAGYRWRDMGHMPSHGTATDGVSTVEWSSTTIDMDYSGIYFTLGIGYDLKH